MDEKKKAVLIIRITTIIATIILGTVFLILNSMFISQHNGFFVAINFIVAMTTIIVIGHISDKMIKSRQPRI